MVANINDNTLVQDANTIEQYVTLRRYVTFVELRRDLAKAIPVDGDRDLRIPGNIILWPDVSWRLAEAMSVLVREGRIHMWPAPVQLYVAQGEILKLPVVYPDDATVYPTPHWMPVLIYPGPFRNPDGSKSGVYERLPELVKKFQEKPGAPGFPTKQAGK
jgi:hypothetical protein